MQSTMTTRTRYLHCGWLIDGCGGPIRQNILLTVTEGTITDIQPFTHRLVPSPDCLIDLSRCTVVPPFIDCHVHLSLSGSSDRTVREYFQQAAYPDYASLIACNLRHHFRQGILALRDSGDAGAHVLRYTQEMGTKEMNKIILQTVGQAWHRPGRYGAPFGRSLPENVPPAGFVARETIGGDLVKIINSGPNSLVEFGKTTAPQFKKEELREIVRLAARQRKKVMVHANGEAPVRLALDAGCHSIEHGYFMGRENLEIMAARQVAWVPTLFAMEACRRSLADGHVARQNLDHQLEQLSLARTLGVPVALGTDAGSPGVPHGASFTGEMKLLLQAGFSLPEVIRSASLQGAQLLDIENRLSGRIVKGHPAHLLAAEADPGQLPGKFAHLRALYIHGAPA